MNGKVDHMKITVEGNKVSANEEELDIYSSVELKDRLLELFENGVRDVVLDLSIVERISTSGLQVLLSAKRSFERMEVEGLQPCVSDELEMLGVEL